jgi:transglutaminase-like putative cysteine protease
MSGYVDDILPGGVNDPMNSEIEQYTQSTPIINYDDPSVVEFARQNAGNSINPREQSISLYYAVRDGIRYDPYDIDLSIEGLRASTTLNKGRGWCITKAVLFTGCCRAVGIPARMGFADVRNHLSTRRMRDTLKTDVVFWHGYASIFINEVWIKITPVFNKELCQRFKLKPLDFDGCHDSIFHSFDMEGERHMEYLKYHGEYPDVPIEKIKETFLKEYPSALSWNQANFDHDVELEYPENN